MYVGVTKRKRPELRWGEKGKGYCGNEYFWRAIQKYGWEEGFSHEYWEVPTEEAMKQCEKDMIAFFNTKSPNGYNLTTGGDGCNDPCEATRELLRQAHLDKPKSDDVKKAISAGNKGKPKSNEHKKSLSIAFSNKWKNDLNYSSRISAANRARWDDPEYHSYMSNLRLGKHLAIGTDGKAHMYTQEEIDEFGLELASYSNKGRPYKGKGSRGMKWYKDTTTGKRIYYIPER